MPAVSFDALCRPLAVHKKGTQSSDIRICLLSLWLHIHTSAHCFSNASCWTSRQRNRPNSSTTTGSTLTRCCGEIGMTVRDKPCLVLAWYLLRFPHAPCYPCVRVQLSSGPFRSMLQPWVSFWNFPCSCAELTSRYLRRRQFLPFVSAR